ncbi:MULTISPECIES: hypothetical protein [Mucilaginibacter]|uniref:Uncharacterized protein n=1 Tax=Mucilaginibacter rubeus TaxID=2027860 RepID=A0AAE6JCB5_9SPHI|nr:MULTISPECIES: hypothetical protein [Mucilaginibacter]SCW55736.1 hypothetical protein SAMN03159284_01830 [Mucilaginibacter sp. NFR10]NVM65684.1 hypothetical protein [Mucilaginibacter sp. SG538B]QEM03027.1 hypothetical protein DIU31_005650 [Mucilaginibacter rubeus]QEM15646.1 hypothetical protein DIU38_005715 [Mucilaginibacter gossypii]QTE41620.1 hypothetical protein J3L19_22085 [Mucilaginibacter rubeus]
MESTLNYLAGFVSLTFMGLSAMYKFKLDKLQGTGKIPNIISARQRQIMFFVLAVLSALIIFISRF